VLSLDAQLDAQITRSTTGTTAGTTVYGTLHCTSPIPTPRPAADPSLLNSGMSLSLLPPGDQFKSQSQFSEYYIGYGWFGTLASFTPGLGYRLKVSEGGDTAFSA
jgi:hypothetical protein